MTYRLRRNALLVSSAILSLSLFNFCGAAFAADQTFEFNIPAKSLGQALTDFSRVSSEQIVFSEDAVTGKSTNGLHGRYSASDALNALLAGSGLRVEVGANGVMMVRPKNVQAASNEAATSADIETVTVTGTQIRGEKPITPVITKTSDEIQASGYSRLDDALAALPQNYAGGASAVSSTFTAAFGENSGYNASLSSGVNLRGLGANATLTLLNGNRLPDTAYGYATDISKIPLSMIDRVEIMTDGATATYGADAVAGVVNIITKRDFDGLEVGARASNMTSGKAPDWDTYILGGTSWSTGNFVLTYDYNKVSPLYASDRPDLNFRPNSRGAFDLLPEADTHSAYGSLTQSIGSNIDLTADLFFSSRQNNAELSQTGAGGFDYLESGVAQQYGANVAANIDLAPGWSATLTGSYSHALEHESLDLNYFVFDFMRPSRLAYGTGSVEGRVNGDLFALPGGDARIALGGLYRHETFALQDCCSNINAGRDVLSGYSEIVLPFIGPANSVSFINSLRGDIAVRYDHYSDFGGALNPKFGLEWSPIADATFHSTYGTSYRAPTLYELNQNDYSAYVFPDPDPTSPTGKSYVLYNTSSLNNLKPEKSKAFDVGLTVQPQSVPGLSVDVSYFDVDFTNKIENLTGYFGLGTALSSAAQLGPLLNLNPTIQQIDALLAPPTVVQYLDDNYNEIAPVPASQIKAIANISTQNVSSVHPQILDGSAKYATQTDFGQIGFSASASYFISYKTLLIPTSTPGAGYGQIGYPTRFRANAQVQWSNAGWSSYARLNFAGAERNQFDLSCGGSSCPVGSYTTIDMGLAYSFSSDEDSMLSGARLSFDVVNILDQKPPYTGGSMQYPYDPLVASPLGRAFAIGLTKRF